MVGWPDEKMRIDPGTLLVGAETLDKDEALDHAQAVADSELGLFFVDSSGVWPFPPDATARHRPDTPT